MRRFSDLFLFLAACLVKPLYIAYLKTIQVQVIHEEFSPDNLPVSRNAIYIFWHSKTFLILPYCRHQQIGILTVLDWKNRFYDFLSRLLGYQTVHVTSRQKATLRLIQLLENGFHVALAVDGPDGPAGVMKPGPAYLAKKTGRPIIPVWVIPQKSFRLNWRWDKYEIPFPFTKAKIVLGRPIEVNETTQDEDFHAREALGPCSPALSGQSV